MKIFYHMLCRFAIGSIRFEAQTTDTPPHLILTFPTKYAKITIIGVLCDPICDTIIIKIYRRRIILNEDKNAKIQRPIHHLAEGC